MNWTWSIRSGDGGMNGLEFSKSLTAGGLTRVLVHAAPSQAQIEVVADDGRLVARGRPVREGEYSPITELVLIDGDIQRREIWPTDDHLGLAVLLPGGEVGVLTAWRHAPDRSWWQWSVEFSNHTDRPPGLGSSRRKAAVLTSACIAPGECYTVSGCENRDERSEDTWRRTHSSVIASRFRSCVRCLR